MSGRKELLLSPVAVGRTGSDREGLYSMFRRTCERNQLHVNDVVYGLVLPLAGPKLNRLRKLIKPLHQMNRGGVLSTRFIARMQESCVAQDWQGATLKELVELQGIAALSIAPYRRWCAHCYSDDCSQPHGPFDRLIWSVELVSVCAVHQTRLEDTCLSCGARRLPVLMGVDISGFCPRCNQFLGGKREPLSGESDEYARYLIWISRTIADLLDEPLPDGHDISTPFKSMLRKISDFHFEGAYCRLAAAASRNKSVIATWLAGRARPGWRAACEISYVFQIPLRDLLIGDAASVTFSALRPLPLPAKDRYPRQRRRPKPRDREQLRTFLSEVVEGIHPSLFTLGAVAERLSIGPSQLRRTLPTECATLRRLLAERRSEFRDRARARREIELERAIQDVGADLAKSDGPLTRRNVELRLRHLGVKIRRPESIALRERVALAKAQALRRMPGSC